MGIRAIHYLNQFFAGFGGEDQADMAPRCLEGARGPGLALQRLEPAIEIAATVVAGDNYVAERLERAVEELLSLIEVQHAAAPIDLLLAGPAFNAGRYGIACAALCEVVEARLGIPSLTALYPDSAAVDLYRRSVTIIGTEADVMGMQAALTAMARAGLELASGKPPGPENQVLPRGLRSNYFAAASGAQRAIEMLMARLEDRPFATEYAMPRFDRVRPAPPIAAAADATIALITTGGIVPRGNPDRIESASASRYGAYSLAGLDRLSPDTHQSVHGGYDPTFANEDPNRVLPLDEARSLERAGRIGRLHETYYATVGNATAVAQAKSFGTEIAPLLVNEGVQAVILTSTWGTCTRCGATIVKELERAGLPAVHVCSIISISKTVGANRIVPSVAIPHPLGDPALDDADEHELRRALLERALTALETHLDGQQVFE